MQAADTTAIEVSAPSGASAEDRETAARLSALVRHLFLYDRGNQIRVLEESGVSLTQAKALLELGGLGGETKSLQVSELADRFGVSAPSMSRAVDGLVRKGLATRAECPDDRRARRVAITASGKDLVDTLVTVRQTGLEAFAATLSPTQRRQLDAAVESLMDREDIAHTYELLKRKDSA